MTPTITRRLLLASAGSFALAAAAVTPAAAQQVSITWLTGNAANTIASAEAIIEAFETKNPDINVELEIRPGGGEGDNIVKTRLATGDMAEVFNYNSGSLFQALNPAQNLVDLTNEPWQADVLESHKTVVTAPDGTVRGGPFGSAMGGGILYSKPIYEELGLSIPKSWDEFMANNAKIKEAGYDPVIQTFGTTWTSQLFVLGDFFNVLEEEPDFPERYTNNQAKYATSEAAMQGFKRQQEIFEAEYLNEDFAAATFEEGLFKLAEGEGAHYPMLTFAISTIGELGPENLQDIGFFAIPGDDAAANGLTTWMPDSIYIPQSVTGEKLEAAKQLVAFVESVEGCEAHMAGATPTGPFLVQGCTLPDDVPPAVADLQTYFNQEGTTAPALEFVSPIKGPALEQITVEVGSGIRSAEEGAALYDEDVRKQAQQLGIPGW